jgi:Ca2+-transporting ATPase
MIAGQVLIIMIGGRALQVVRLNGAQWGYSIALGFLSIPIAVITRCVPDDAFQRIVPRRWWSQHGRVVSNGSQQTDWDSALLKVREEIELVSWVHGGRLHAREWRGTSHRKSGLKPVAVMAGLIAGSIGGWPRT